MIIERKKNAFRNVFYGTILKTYQIIIPFFMRTAMIYFMGVQYLGLNSLLSSILQVLNLTELGVGAAMVYSMYRPIAEDDTAKICALMRLYKIYYRIIGIVIAIIGGALTPFIPKLISGDVPSDINIYVLYLLNLASTVLSYWLFAYKNSILHAHQRVDISIKISIVTSTVQYVSQFIVLWVFRDYYLYLLVAMFLGALSNIVTAFVVNKYYPQYQPVGKLPQNEVRLINKRIRDLFTAKIGSIVVNSVDTIVISAFLGLKILAVYQNYYFILTSIVGFVAVIFQACTAGIGNSIITETKSKNFNDLIKLTFIINWIAAFCSCCFLNLYQPFMRIWVGDELLLAYPAVIFLVIYYYILEVNQLLFLYKDAAGIWHEDRFRPLTTSAVNLLMNLAMVNYWGIYGVILSTVLSMLFVGMPWLFHNLFSTIFQMDMLGIYLKKLFCFAIVSITVCIATTLLCSTINLDNWATLILRLLICIVVPNMILWTIFHSSIEFKQTIVILKSIAGRKIRLR